MLVNLAHHSNKELVAWPSKSTIAKETGLSIRTVDRAIKSLEQRRLIIVEPRYRENGAHTSHRYRLTFTHGEAQEPSSSVSGGPVGDAVENPSREREGPGTVAPLEPVIENTNTNTNTNTSGGAGGASTDREAEVDASDADHESDSVVEGVNRFRLEVALALLEDSKYLQVEGALLRDGLLHADNSDVLVAMVNEVWKELKTGACPDEKFVGRVVYRARTSMTTAPVHGTRPPFDLAALC